MLTRNLLQISNVGFQDIDGVSRYRFE